MVDGIVDIPLPGQQTHPVGNDAAAGRAHFVAGPENRLVDVAVRSVLEESDISFNPLVLYGPSGIGKSHIARGLAAVWKGRAGRQRVVCTTAVEFARELADAIDSQAVEEFRQKYRSVDLLVLEDLGQLATKTSAKINAQEEFINTLDTLVAESRWVIVTASAPPAELPDLLPALQSRLTAGLVIPIAPPGPDARRIILQNLAALREIDLPETIAQSLAEGLSGTAPELAGALMQIASAGGFQHRRVDRDHAERFLSSRRNKQPDMHEIALATARHFSLRLADLRSAVRRRALVSARGVAIYLARHFAGMSLQEIGHYLGGRDHTTIMHSLQKTEEIRKSDSAIHAAITRLHQELWKT